MNSGFLEKHQVMVSKIILLFSKSITVMSESTSHHFLAVISVIWLQLDVRLFKPERVVHRFLIHRLLQAVSLSIAGGDDDCGGTHAWVGPTTCAPSLTVAFVNNYHDVALADPTLGYPSQKWHVVLTTAVSGASTWHPLSGHPGDQHLHWCVEWWGSHCGMFHEVLPPPLPRRRSEKELDYK